MAHSEGNVLKTIETITSLSRVIAMDFIGFISWIHMIGSSIRKLSRFLLAGKCK